MSHPGGVKRRAAAAEEESWCPSAPQTHLRPPPPLTRSATLSHVRRAGHAARHVRGEPPVPL
eukprot:2201928-Pyramimonas_sp.AAC.1